MNIKITEDMNIVSQNIRPRDSLSYRRMLEDMIRIREQDPSIICFQQFRWPSCWLALREVFPKTEWTRQPSGITRQGSSVLIVISREHWRKVGARVDVVNDRQLMNVALLEHNGTGLRMSVKNTHYIPSTQENRSVVLAGASARDSVFGHTVNELPHEYVGGNKGVAYTQIVPGTNTHLSITATECTRISRVTQFHLTEMK